ncbi:MAG TPA: LCP family protein [Mycobacteriales bacterium]|nr:LCP family protein [Mycobacteriales bacterium]
MTGKRRADGESERSSGGRDPRLRPPSLVPPPSTEVVITPELSRREERRQRKRQQRRKLGVAGGIGVALLAIAGITTLVLGVNHVVTHSGGKKRTQMTLLFQLQASNRTAAGSVLLAADPSAKQGLEVLIPDRLITDVCGYGSQNFGSVLALPNGVAASRSALSTVLGGVTVDGSWVISEPVLATLINTVGGIDIDIDTNVIQHTAGGGGRILIAAGPGQHLNGQQALEYATYQPAREGAAGVLARLQGVLDATIQKLPRTTVGVAALIRQLPRTAQPTVSVQDLAQLLVDIATYDQTEAGVFPTDLPVTTIDAGGLLPSYRADNSPSGIKQLVDTRLQGSLPSSANTQHASVYVLNGIGVPGLAQTACAKLTDNGFTYAGSGNAPTFSNNRSQVDIFRDSDAGQGRELAKALGLPASDVRRSVVNQSVARYVVILGSDYKP